MRLLVDCLSAQLKPQSPLLPFSPTHAITHYPFTLINSPDHSYLTVYCNHRWWNSRPSAMTKGAQGRIKATHCNTVANIFFFLSCLRLYRWERPNGKEVEMKANLLDTQVVSADYISDWLYILVWVPFLICVFFFASEICSHFQSATM